MNLKDFFYNEGGKYGNLYESVFFKTKTDLKNDISSILESKYLSFNTPIVRQRIIEELSFLLESRKNSNEITKYQVICDDTNNLNRDILSLDVLVQPAGVPETRVFNYKITS